MSFAQDGNFLKKHFGVNDGLPSSQVYRTIQDKKGYWWFATDRGIAKFDGKEFLAYDDFVSSVFLDVYPDQKDGVWAYNMDGWVLHISSDGAMRRVSLPFYKKKLKEFRLFNTFQVDENGNFVLNFVGSSYLVSSSGALIQKQLNSSSNKSDNSYGLYWVLNDSLRKFSVNYDQAQKQVHLTVEGKQGDQFLPLTSNQDSDLKRHLLFERKTSGYNYAYTSRNIWSPHQKSRPVFTSNDNKILIVQGIKKDEVFVGLREDGAIIYNHKTQKTIQLLDNCTVSSFYTDNFGNIWISTLWNGVYVISRDQISFDFENRKVRSLSSNGDFVLGVLSSGEIFKFYGNSTSKIYENPMSYHPKVLNISPNQFVSMGTVSEIVTDGIPKKLPIGSALVGAHKNGNFWMCVGRKLTVWGYTDNQLKVKLTRFISEYPEVIHLINEQEAIIGTRNGLFKIRTQGDQIHEECLIPDIRVVDIDVHGNGYILSTRGYGVLMVNSKFEIIDRISTQNGLKSNQVIRTSIHGPLIWVASKKGIQSFHYKPLNTKLVSSFDNIHGGEEIQDFLIQSDQLYIASNTKMHRIDVRNALQMAKSHSAPSLVEFDFNVLSEKQDWSINESTELNSKQNNINVFWKVLVSPFFASPVYRYQLRERGQADAGWITTKKESADFLNQKPGRYDFQLEIQLTNGKWVQLKEHSFTIHPPWWEQAWARVSFVILIALFVFLVIRKYFRDQLSKKERSLEIQLLKSKALRAQMNPHFIFNALNSVQRHISEDNHEDAGRYLAQFSRMIRKILENSNKEFLLVSEEISLVQQYLLIEKNRFKDRFDFDIQNVSCSVSKLLIPAFTIQPLVENAIRHGVEKTEKHVDIFIGIEEAGEFIIVSVKNTQSTIKSLHTSDNLRMNSFGLRGIHERLKSLDKDCGITILKEIPNQVTVQVKIPKITKK